MGVQFHPEFDKSIMKEYILKQKDAIEELDISIKKLLNDLKSCDISNTVLKNFSYIIEKKV